MDPSILKPWHDFFMLVGSASATLLGLVFVATSIAASIPKEKLGTARMRAVWIVPLIYAFGRVLTVCAIGVLPDLGGLGFGSLIAVLGTGDLGREIWVLVGLLESHRTQEKLTRTDWRWYFIYPFASTSGLVLAGILLVTGHPGALYLLSFCVLWHLIIGIHNTWEIADFLSTVI